MRVEFAMKELGGLQRVTLIAAPLLLVTSSSLARADSIGASAARALGKQRVDAARPMTARRTVITPRNSLSLSVSGLSVLKQPQPRALGEGARAAWHLRKVEARVGQPEALDSHVAFPIKWENTPVNVSPRVVSIVRNFRHNGLPIVRLWGSGRSLVAFGLNPHGVPGIYFTQKMD